LVTANFNKNITDNVIELNKQAKLAKYKAIQDARTTEREKRLEETMKMFGNLKSGNIHGF
jgi:ABC-type lipoprotein release transport system permease subunit